MRHVCDYCGKRLSAIRRFRGERFCAPQHEQLYEARQAELAVERMREEFALDDQIVITQPLPAAAQSPFNAPLGQQKDIDANQGFDPSPSRRGLDSGRPSPFVAEAAAESTANTPSKPHPSEAYPSQTHVAQAHVAQTHVADRFAQQTAKLAAPLVATNLAPYAITSARPAVRNHSTAVQGRRDWQDFGTIQKPHFTPRLPNLEDLLSPLAPVELTQVPPEQVPPEQDLASAELAHEKSIPENVAAIQVAGSFEDPQNLPQPTMAKTPPVSAEVVPDLPLPALVSATPPVPQVAAAQLPLAGLLPWSHARGDLSRAAGLYAKFPVRGAAHIIPSLSPGRIILPKLRTVALPNSVLGAHRLAQPDALLEWSKPWVAVPPAAFVPQPAAALPFPLGAQVPDWQYPKFQGDPLFSQTAAAPDPALAPVADVLADLLTGATDAPLHAPISGGMPAIQAAFSSAIPSLAGDATPVFRETSVRAPELGWNASGLSSTPHSIHVAPAALQSAAAPTLSPGSSGGSASTRGAFALPEPLLEARSPVTGDWMVAVLNAPALHAIAMQPLSEVPNLVANSAAQAQNQGVSQPEFLPAAAASEVSPILPDAPNPLFMRRAEPGTAGRPSFAPVSFGRPSPSPWYSQANAQGPRPAGPSPATAAIELAGLTTSHRDASSQPATNVFPASAVSPFGPAAYPTGVHPPCGPVLLGMLSPATGSFKEDPHPGSTPLGAGAALAASLVAIPAMSGLEAGLSLSASPTASLLSHSGPVPMAALSPAAWSSKADPHHGPALSLELGAASEAFTAATPAMPSLEAGLNLSAAPHPSLLSLSGPVRMAALSLASWSHKTDPEPGPSPSLEAEAPLAVSPGTTPTMAGVASGLNLSSAPNASLLSLSGPVSIAALSPADWSPKADSQQGSSPLLLEAGAALTASFGAAPAMAGLEAGLSLSATPSGSSLLSLCGPLSMAALSQAAWSLPANFKTLYAATASVTGESGTRLALPASLRNSGATHEARLARSAASLGGASITSSAIQFSSLRPLQHSAGRLPAAEGAMTAFSLRRHLSLRSFELPSGFGGVRLTPGLAAAHNQAGRGRDSLNYALELGTRIPYMEAPTLRSAARSVPASPIRLLARNRALSRLPAARQTLDLLADPTALDPTHDRVEAAARLAPQSAPQQVLNGARNLAAGRSAGLLLRPEPFSTGGSTLLTDSHIASSFAETSRPLSAHALQSAFALGSQPRKLPLRSTERGVGIADPPAGSLPPAQRPPAPGDILSDVDFIPVLTAPESETRLPGQRSSAVVRGLSSGHAQSMPLQQSFAAAQPGYAAGGSSNWCDAAAVLPGEAGQPLDHPTRIPTLEARPGLRLQTMPSQRSAPVACGREAATALRRAVPSFSGRFSPAELLVMPGRPLAVTRSSVPEHFSDPQRHIAPLFKLHGEPHAGSPPLPVREFNRPPAAIQPKPVSRMQYPAIVVPHIEPRVPANRLEPIESPAAPVTPGSGGSTPPADVLRSESLPVARPIQATTSWSDRPPELNRTAASIDEVAAQPPEYPGLVKSDALLATERRWQSWKNNLARKRPAAAAPVLIGASMADARSTEISSQTLSATEPTSTQPIIQTGPPTGDPKPMGEAVSPLLRRPPRSAAILMPGDRFRARLLKEAGGRSGIDAFRHVPEALLEPASQSGIIEVTKTGTGGSRE